MTLNPFKKNKAIENTASTTIQMVVYKFIGVIICMI